MAEQIEYWCGTALYLAGRPLRRVAHACVWSRIPKALETKGLSNKLRAYYRQ